MGVEGRGAKGLGGTEKAKRREIDARGEREIEQQPLKRKKIIACSAKENKFVTKCIFNLVPRAFLRRGEDGREKTLASADHVTNLNIKFPTNLC